jgi:Uma2 family endonuclease
MKGEMDMAITLNLHPVIELTDERFEQICQSNREWKFERTAQGELVILSPTGGQTGNRNWKLTGQFWGWSQQNNLGEGFDSSTGFRLPNGATRSPDFAWVRLERWQALTPEQQRKFVPLCPDFAIELRSPSDELGELQLKMQEYLDNGLRLGWLIDPESRQVEIYRSGQQVEVLENPKTLSGEAVLPGFVLNLSTIFV